MKEQAQKIEERTADIDHLQKQNTELKSKMDDATELANTNVKLTKDKDAVSKQLDSLALQLNEARDGKKVLRQEVQELKLELATKDAPPAVINDKALLEKVMDLEKKNGSLEVNLQEWTELAKV